MGNTKDEPLDYERMRLELRRNLWRLAQPPDLEELAQKGLLEKKGAWYRVPDMSALPEHVWAKGTAVKQDDTGALFQFSKAFKKSQALATKMGVDWRGPEPQ